MSYVQRPFIVGSTSAPAKNNNAAGLRYYDVAGVLDYNAPYTMMCWMRVSACSLNYQTSVMQVARALTGTQYGLCDLLTPSANDAQSYLTVSHTNSSGWLGGAAGTQKAFKYSAADGKMYPLTYTDPLFWSKWDRVPENFNWGVGAWVHFAIVRESATLIKWYVNGVLDGSFTNPTPTRSAAQVLMFGGRHLGSSYEWTAGSGTDFSGSVKIAYARAWSRALTITDLNVERGYTSAFDAAALYGDWPLTADLNDASGNGRHLTRVPATPDVALEDVAEPHVYEWDADVPSGVVPPIPPVTGTASGFSELYGTATGVVTPYDPGDPLGARARVLVVGGNRHIVPAYEARVRTREGLTARARSYPLLPEE